MAPADLRSTSSDATVRTRSARLRCLRSDRQIARSAESPCRQAIHASCTRSSMRPAARARHWRARRSDRPWRHGGKSTRWSIVNSGRRHPEDAHVASTHRPGTRPRRNDMAICLPPVFGTGSRGPLATGRPSRLAHRSTRPTAWTEHPTASARSACLGLSSPSSSAWKYARKTSIRSLARLSASDPMARSYGRRQGRQLRRSALIGQKPQIRRIAWADCLGRLDALDLSSGLAMPSRSIPGRTARNRVGTKTTVIS